MLLLQDLADLFADFRGQQGLRSDSSVAAHVLLAIVTSMNGTVEVVEVKTLCIRNNSIPREDLKVKGEKTESVAEP